VKPASLQQAMQTLIDSVALAHTTVFSLVGGSPQMQLLLSAKLLFPYPASLQQVMHCSVR
jgi:prolyl-tRNA editing enzyme YbaK/EbsC (Cys-tRNA(Pro) deacylase)